MSQMKPDADKSAGRGKSFDMSPEAILRRLQICSDLSAACRELQKAKRTDQSRKSDE